MSQTAIPLQFEKYLRDKVSLGKSPQINEMIFAYIPDLDPSQPIDRSQGLPPMSQWVYQRTIDQVGKMGDNALAYSVVVPDSEDAFTFNAIFMRDKDVPDSCAFVVHKADETKEVGSTLTRTLVMEFDGAAELAGIHVDTETWQIDYSARLLGMDEDLRFACFDIYGHTAYINGFDVSRHTDPNKYIISAGVVYVSGLRFELPAQLVQTVIDKPATLYVEVYRDGTALSVWKNHGQVIASQSPMADYTNANGRPHYVTKLARINSDGNIEDLRQRGGLQAHLDAEDPHSQYIPKSAIATIEEAKKGKKGKLPDAKGVHAAFEQYGWGADLPPASPTNLYEQQGVSVSRFGGRPDYPLASLGGRTVINLPYDSKSQAQLIIKSQYVSAPFLPEFYYRVVDPSNGDIKFSVKMISSSDKATTATAQAGSDDEKYLTSYTANKLLDMVGFVLWSSGKQQPKGRWIKPARVELSRTAYADLWQFAQDSGILVEESLKDSDPETYAPCYGTGDGATTFTTPDYRGEFFRVWDDGRGVDSGRDFGSYQREEIGNIKNVVMSAAQIKSYGSSRRESYHPIQADELNEGLRKMAGTGNETRPRNLALVAWLRY